tara:strand:+ start:19851 stop:20168 length:318 start_codon:yes stop_codon:yes gene_type:complete
MILTTTNSIEGKTITHYLGIVSDISYTATFSGAGMSLKDMFSSKKYYAAYEKSILEAKEAVFQKIRTHAENLKANAIVGIKVDVEAISGSMTSMISVVGTAVVVV